LHFNLANSFLQQYKYEEAITNYQNTLKIKPTGRKFTLTSAVVFPCWGGWKKLSQLSASFGIKTGLGRGLLSHGTHSETR
jgi:hypothetical protein